MNTAATSGIQEGARRQTWAQARNHAQQLRESLSANTAATVVVSIPTGLHLTTVLLATRDSRLNLVIIGPHTHANGLEWTKADIYAEPVDGGRFHIHRCPPAPDTRQERNGPGVAIMSSGTTGAPHPSWWSWEDLTHGKPWPAPGGYEHWAIGYAPHTFAGVTAVCQAMSRARMLEFINPADLSGTDQNPRPLDVVAATPSFWRLAVAMAGSPASVPPIVTAAVGGEPVDTALLRRMRDVFAPQRINQVFAASEFGTLLAIDDELPGLPAKQAGVRQPNGLAFDLHVDQLRVSRAPGQPFLPTGDMIERTGDRIKIVGRVGLHINVGGMKVNPYKVADTLQQHPKVLIARAYPIPSPVLGQVVAAQVVPAGTVPDPHAFAHELRRFCTGRLQAFARPMHIELVDEITLAASRKVAMQP